MSNSVNPRSAPARAGAWLCAVAVVVTGFLVVGAPQGAVARAATGEVALVQAVPDQTVDLVVDGRVVRSKVKGGTAVGPMRMTPGRHTVAFRSAAGTTNATVQVAAGRSTDVVLHRPASAAQPSVVSQYATPNKPIGPGKARVLLAHTALVPPADVQVDGKTVFTNIANGEFATADLPAGRHTASLVLSGGGTRILGPLPVDLAARTATMIYAVGSPSNGSMNVVTRTIRLQNDGSIAPTKVDTGSVGLVGDVPVDTFGAPPTSATP